MRLRSSVNMPPKDEDTLEKPDKFDWSHTTDVKSFFERFEECTKYNEWFKEKQLQAFPLYLTGNAKIFYRNLAESSKKSIEILRQSFKSYYNSEDQLWQLRTKLHNLRQNE